jgi:hypothetical protein
MASAIKKINDFPAIQADAESSTETFIPTDFSGGGAIKAAGDMDPEERRNYWRQIIHHFNLSGKSGRSYCKQHKLSYEQFRYWHYQFRSDYDMKTTQTPQKKGAGNPTANRFVPAIIGPAVHNQARKSGTIHPEQSLKRYCTLELGMGRSLIIESPEALAQIAAVIKAVI